MTRALTTTLLALSVLATSTASAQEAPPPPDQKVGEQATDEGSDFSPEKPPPSPALETYPQGYPLVTTRSWPEKEVEKDVAYVDRRGEIDPMAGSAILWPTAYTAEKGTFTYSNFFFWGNSLSYAFTDDQELGLTVVLPSLGATHLQVAHRVRLSDGPNHIVTVIPILHYQTEGENDEVTTSAFSLGAGVVSDFYLADDFVVGVGAHLHGTLAASTSQIAPAECPDRDAFLDDRCTEVVREWRGFPSGGHWLALVGHATYYISEYVNIRSEVFTGGVAGTFLGTEYIYGRERLATRSQRYGDGDFAVGIPYDSLVTAGLGAGFTFRNFGMQLSGYMYYWDEDIRLTPMFTASVAF